jgi:hypothetical protein
MRLPRGQLLHRPGAFPGKCFNQSEFTLIRGDTLDSAALTRAMNGADMVFHLAANADVRFGTEHPRRDLEQNTIATFNVLGSDAPERRPAYRVRIDGIDLRRGHGHPNTRKRALPRPNLALRRLEACRRRLDPGLLRRLWLSGLDLPIRIDPANVTHTVTSSISSRT